MATILDEFYSFINFASTGFKYNLQVFPDTMTAAALLFTLLFQSAPFGALTGSIVLLRVLHPVMATFFASVLNGAVGPGDAQRCSGVFPGASFERLIGAASRSEFGALSDSSWPSFYTTFLGFLLGYIGLLPVVYQAEIEASPKRKASTITGLLILALIVVIGVLYRVGAECDTGFGIAVGVVSGFLIGAMLVAFLAWISERRITNILGFPLLRSRAKDGEPIYVCKKSV